MPRMIKAGASAIDITPRDSQFLFGYPHVKRYSTGVHDPLWCSALFLDDGRTRVLFLANDLIGISKSSAARIRAEIERAAGVPAGNIMVTATHTHSGPKTEDYLASDSDPVVPKIDPNYLRWMEERVVEAGVSACRSAQEAEIGLAVADGTGVGTNRRDPAGPSDPQVPVLVVRPLVVPPSGGLSRMPSRAHYKLVVPPSGGLSGMPSRAHYKLAVPPSDGQKPIAVMAVCSMHPTVLHEDSTLISGDFPGLSRQYLQKNLLGAGCPILLHTGPAGNQSPRHVVRGQTFAEAERLGERLGRAVEAAMAGISFRSSAELACIGDRIDLPRKTFLSLPAAEAKLKAAVDRLAHLRQSGATSQQVRTAECDWFGAEESVELARAAADGRLDEAYRFCLPAEIQAIRVGPWTFVGWPGEVFVEYALAVKAAREGTFVISLANGGLHGYIVTPEAAAEGGYEASNSLFPPEAGKMLVERTLRLLARLP